MPSEIFETDGEPGRACVRLGKRLGGPKILANNFAHDPISIGATRPHVTRRGYKTEVAQAVLDRAQSAVPSAIKIDLACPLSHARMLQMSFERYQRSARPFQRKPAFYDAPSQGARSTGCVNRYWSEISRVNPGLLHDNAAHRVIFKDNIDDLRVLNYFSTCVDGSAQKTLIHFGATQTPGKTIRLEPRAWYCDTPSILRIKDSFAKA